MPDNPKNCPALFVYAFEFNYLIKQVKLFNAFWNKVIFVAKQKLLQKSGFVQFKEPPISGGFLFYVRDILEERREACPEYFDYAQYKLYRGKSRSLS